MALTVSDFSLDSYRSSSRCIHWHPLASTGTAERVCASTCTRQLFNHRMSTTFTALSNMSVRTWLDRMNDSHDTKGNSISVFNSISVVYVCVYTLHLFAHSQGHLNQRPVEHSRRSHPSPAHQTRAHSQQTARAL